MITERDLPLAALTETCTYMYMYFDDVHVYYVLVLLVDYSGF